ncbi:MAG: MCE family protein [Proteobacteria bacterium]|nr:MCE family protein [Pseudomonadota bacterium]
MGRNAIETVMGAVVLIVAGLFLVFAYSSADLRKVKGYMITANFPMVDGLKEGGDVKINGVKVGSISGMELITNPGPDEYLVRTTMTVLPTVDIPTDSIALAASESLLGGKYLSIEIGVDEELLPKDGTGKLTRTQAPMRLDDLIGQLIYSNKTSTADQAPAAPATPSAAPADVLAPAKAPEPEHP